MEVAQVNRRHGDRGSHIGQRDANDRERKADLGVLLPGSGLSRILDWVRQRTDKRETSALSFNHRRARA
jgi:hypothetical protein